MRKTIHQGSQFKGASSNLGFVMLLFSLGGFIFWNTQSFVPASLVLLPVAVVALELLRNRRGVELDPEMGQARAFTSFFGIRSGQWQSISHFDKVILVKDYFTLMSGPATVPFLRGQKRRVSSFDVLLTDSKGNELFLKESSSHSEAKRILRDVSEFLKLPAEDRLQTTIDQLQARRRKMGRR